MKNKATKHSIGRNVKLPDILFANERESLLKVIDSFEDLIFVRLGMFSGLRIAEIMGIKPQDINFNESCVFVIGKGQKPRYIPVDHSTLSIIKCYVKTNNISSENNIFNSTNRTMQYRIEKYGKKANIERFKLVPHILRHTACSLMLHRGMQVEMVMKVMGHADIETTMIYFHVTPSIIVKSYYEVMGGP